MYQSHKGWTSNYVFTTYESTMVYVSIPQGVDVKLSADSGIIMIAPDVSIPQGVDVKRFSPITRYQQRISCINPTRGGRQTETIFSNQSYCSCINPTRGGRQTCYISVNVAVSIVLCINPTRGGRQTCGYMDAAAGVKMYQSHKGWTSNYQWQLASEQHRSINPTRGGRQTR